MVVRAMHRMRKQQGARSTRCTITSLRTRAEAAPWSGGMALEQSEHPPCWPESSSLLGLSDELPKQTPHQRGSLILLDRSFRQKLIHGARGIAVEEYIFYSLTYSRRRTAGCSGTQRIPINTTAQDGGVVGAKIEILAMRRPP